MQITTLISAAAITLAATIGSVSAAEQFTTLGGISAVPMSSSELGAVRGKLRHFVVTTKGKGLINPDSNAAATPLSGGFFRVGGTIGTGAGGGAPGYNGLLAEPGVISIP